MQYLPAGIGKSTLLNLIGGTLQPTKGHITRNAKASVDGDKSILEQLTLLTCTHEDLLRVL